MVGVFRRISGRLYPHCASGLHAGHHRCPFHDPIDRPDFELVLKWLESNEMINEAKQFSSSQMEDLTPSHSDNSSVSSSYDEKDDLSV